MTEDALRDALFAYSLAHTGDTFLHQHVADALTAQTATATTPPRRLVYALVGLCLHVEHRVTGRAVQQAHARLASITVALPVVPLPTHRGDITGADVLAAPEGQARDALVSAWCASVWAAYGHARADIAVLSSHAWSQASDSDSSRP